MDPRQGGPPDPADRQAYLHNLSEAISGGGFCIISTFGLNGPERCSGLPVQRYNAETLQQVVGDGYALVRSCSEQHPTPGGTVQQFNCCLFQRRN